MTVRSVLLTLTLVLEVATGDQLSVVPAIRLAIGRVGCAGFGRMVAVAARLAGGGAGSVVNIFWS